MGLSVFTFTALCVLVLAFTFLEGFVLGIIVGSVSLILFVFLVVHIADHYIEESIWD
jgi:hypothetical protein